MGDGATTSRRTLAALANRLAAYVAKDPDMDVQGFALPALNEALEEARTLLPDDPVAQALDLVTAEAIAEDRAVLASEALLAVEMLLARLGPEPEIVPVPRGATLRRPEVRRPTF